MSKFYDEDKLDFLAATYAEEDIHTTTRLFNYAFGCNKTADQIKSVLTRHKIRSGRTGRFTKGQTSWNKGKSFCAGGRSAETRFKKGNRPVNHRPVGSERISKDGYVEVKVEEPRKWRFKHLVVWEEHYGPVPDGYIVTFRDNDKTNINPENLMLMTRKQSCVINKIGLSQVHGDLKDTAVLMADLRIKARERVNA